MISLRKHPIFQNRAGRFTINTVSPALIAINLLKETSDTKDVTTTQHYTKKKSICEIDTTVRSGSLNLVKMTYDPSQMQAISASLILLSISLFPF